MATIRGAQLPGQCKVKDAISDSWVLRKDEGNEQGPTSNKDSGWIPPIGDLEMSTKDIIGVIEIEMFSEMAKASREERPLPKFYEALHHIRHQIRQRIELSDSRADYGKILQSATNPLTVWVLSGAISEAR